MTRTLDSVLQQHIAGLAGVQAVVLGNSMTGKALCAINYSSHYQDDNDSIAGYATDLLQANARFCHIFSPDSAIDYVMGGSKDNKLLVRAIPDSPHFVSFVVSSQTAIKHVLPRVQAIIVDSKPLLPSMAEQQNSQAKALVDYAKRYAPDPAFVMMRLSLKTGIAVERLEKANLQENEIHVLHGSIKDILGTEHLPVAVGN